MSTSNDRPRPAKLALADGTVYSGQSLGASGEVTGEVVFNTSMTGYQEILTDPSYCGQIITMTYPEIGDYGVNSVDVERHATALSGFVIRNESRIHSNYGVIPEGHSTLMGGVNKNLHLLQSSHFL